MFVPIFKVALKKELLDEVLKLDRRGRSLEFIFFGTAFRRLGQWSRNLYSSIRMCRAITPKFKIIFIGDFNIPTFTLNKDVKR